MVPAHRKKTKNTEGFPPVRCPSGGSDSWGRSKAATRSCVSENRANQSTTVRSSSGRPLCNSRVIHIQLARFRYIFTCRRWVVTAPSESDTATADTQTILASFSLSMNRTQLKQKSTTSTNVVPSRLSRSDATQRALIVSGWVKERYVERKQGGGADGCLQDECFYLNKCCVPTATVAALINAPTTALFSATTNHSKECAHETELLLSKCAWNSFNLGPFLKRGTNPAEVGPCRRKMGGIEEASRRRTSRSSPSDAMHLANVAGSFSLSIPEPCLS